jgi:hypothetical protein
LTAPLTPFWQAALILAFGAATSGFVLFFGRDPMAVADLLLLSASLGALVTAGLWLWIIAASHSRGWNLAFAFTFWIPYVNFVVASLFARRYWSQGARAPALLALAGIVGQTIVSVRLLAPGVTAPV